jgi:hypothetical protein
MKKIWMFLLLFSLSVFQLNASFDEGIFIENKGQFPDDVKYVLRLPGETAIFKNNSVTLDYQTNDTQNENMVLGHAVSMNFVSGKSSNIKVENEVITKFNYFIGADKSKHVSGARGYKNITMNAVYPGIDVKFSIDENKLRYDFHVAPGADISKIKLAFAGLDNKPFINQENALTFETSVATISHTDIYAYQGNKAVKCILSDSGDGNIGFIVEGYDKEKGLVIDPRIYSTYFGGSGDEVVPVFVDATSAGEPVVAGTTKSMDVDISDGAYSRQGTWNICIAKFSDTGKELLYCTYFGGKESEPEKLGALLVALDNRIIIAGNTNADNSSLPITEGCFQDNNASPFQDAFISIFSSDCSTLLSSSFYGSMLEEKPTALAVDSTGNIYLAGTTTSKSLPKISSGAQENQGSVQSDGFIAKMSMDLTEIYQSTYLGGNGTIDDLTSIEITENGDVTVAGITNSDDLPFTSNALYRDSRIAQMPDSK